jgi:hypothetical protein
MNSIGVGDVWCFFNIIRYLKADLSKRLSLCSMQVSIQYKSQLRNGLANAVTKMGLFRSSATSLT